jgi:alpha-beta hydrolase superfamily lysophospholipase
MPGDIELFDHREYSWTSADGLKLFAQSWMPQGSPRAIVNYVHGFKDHSNRFSHWAIKLAQEGFGVIAIDLRGHGRSEGRRGYADSFERYLQDVRMLCDYSRQNYPDITQILYGHSLGGNIVTNYLISGRELPDAAVITSPWFKLAFEPSVFTRAMAFILSYILPGILVRSDLDTKGLSRNPKIGEDYLKDPLVHNRISPKLFFAVEKQGAKASHSIFKINIPLLVMHGTADIITSFRQTRAFVLHAGCRTTFKEWPGCQHELHNELCADEIFAFLICWLNEQVSG